VLIKALIGGFQSPIWQQLKGQYET